jgi:catechol-2,3-dioxygenase
MPSITEKTGPKVISPSKLAHIVLHTNKYDAMVEFWINFLGGRLVYGNDFLSFITYDDEHHRIAIAQLPGFVDKPAHTTGLAHVAFTFDTLRDLMSSYQQRKELGIEPFWCVNHGTTTSIYYTDPDGNEIETQVDNFDTIEETNRFMTSPLFDMNAIGTDFHPDDLIFRLESGESEESIKKRVEIGKRTMPEVRSIPPPQLVKAS